MNYGISILFRAIPLAMALFCFGYGSFVYDYGDAGSRLVAGPIVFSLGMICVALFCMATIIIRQVNHTYNRTFTYVFPIIGYLISAFTILWGIYLFKGASSFSAFVAGHVIAGVGLITVCVASAATSSTRFSLIPANSKDSGHEVPESAFSIGQERALEIVTIIASLAAWIWAFALLGKSDTHPIYFVAGHVMVGIACICTSLIALVATIARQIRNVYSEKERSLWSELVLLMGTVSFVWGLFVVIGDAKSSSGVIGYIMIGSGMACYSISSKVILLSLLWRQESKLANRFSLIPILAAFTCLLLSAFVFELGAVHPEYFIPACILVGLGGVCFALFSIVSILESSISSTEKGV